MDSTACWYRLLNALGEGNAQEAHDAAEDLFEWLRIGGCPVQGWNPELVHGMLSWTLSRWPDRIPDELEGYNYDD